MAVGKINGSLAKPTRAASVEVNVHKFSKHSIFDLRSAAWPSWYGVEIGFCFLVVIGTLIYAWIKLYMVSLTYDWKTRPAFFQLNNLFGILEKAKDVSDTEWVEWSHFAQKLFPFYLLHAILFNLTSDILPCRVWSALMMVCWLVAVCTVLCPTSVATAIAIGCAMYTVTAVIRSTIIVWLMTCGFLHLTLEMLSAWAKGSSVRNYALMTFFSYKIVHFTSYCLDSINFVPQAKTSFLKGLYEMLWYSFYPPYFIYLIVPFKHFKEQMDRRKSEKRSLCKAAFFALRIVFWYILINIVLHFFYFNSMVYDIQFLDQVPRDVLCSLGCAIGQFFHAKYVVIFGLQAMFAKLDNLEPPAGPICISRVVLYSNLWRYFDRGMYTFFKEYIFLPICRPTFSVFRRLAAMFICFAFVICWHGNEHNYLVWAAFNIAEILLENISKAVYSISAVKAWRERNISDAAFRRILAVLYLVPYTIGLYSNFYFLSTSEGGYIFVKKVFWSDTVHLRYPFLILICLGYCFTNVLIETEPYFKQEVNKSTQRLKSSSTVERSRC